MGGIKVQAASIYFIFLFLSKRYVRSPVGNSDPKFGRVLACDPFLFRAFLPSPVPVITSSRNEIVERVITAVANLIKGHPLIHVTRVSVGTSDDVRYRVSREEKTIEELVVRFKRFYFLLKRLESPFVFPHERYFSARSSTVRVSEEEGGEGEEDRIDNGAIQKRSVLCRRI